MSQSRKASFFWPVVLAVFLTDCATKAVAVERLGGDHPPYRMFGDLLQFTLTYNRGAALSLDLGAASRYLLTSIAPAVLGGLTAWYRRTSPDARLQLLGLALLWAGAAGNLLDRLKDPRGVVDFIAIS